MLHAINDWSFVGLVFVIQADILGNQRPKLFHVDCRAHFAMLDQMEIPHTDLSEVTRVVLIEVDTVVVLTTGISATTRVLAVLADTTAAGTDVTAEVTVLLESGGHGV